MSKDYYAVLGLPRNATTRQIKGRFLELARDRHPDRFRGSEKERAEVEFQAITEAFNILSDAERRRQHDMMLARPSMGEKPVTSQAAEVYISRGKKAYREKNYLEAAENFDRATKEDPSNAEAWYHLALACRHQSRWLVRGRKAILKACELASMNAKYLKLAGELAARTGMTAKAVKFYTDALTLGGEDAEIEAALSELRNSGGKSKSLFGRGG